MHIFYAVLSPDDMAIIDSEGSSRGMLPMPLNDFQTFWMMRSKEDAMAEAEEIAANSSEYDFLVHLICIEVSDGSLAVFKESVIESSSRKIWTVLREDWASCASGLRYVKHECEVGRAEQWRRRREWLLADHFEILGVWLDAFRNERWTYEPVASHDHCPACFATMSYPGHRGCSSHGFRLADSDSFDYFCGRCYSALLEISREQI